MMHITYSYHDKVVGVVLMVLVVVIAVVVIISQSMCSQVSTILKYFQPITLPFFKPFMI